MNRSMLDFIGGIVISIVMMAAWLFLLFFMLQISEAI